MQMFVQVNEGLTEYVVLYEQKASILKLNTAFENSQKKKNLSNIPYFTEV